MIVAIHQPEHLPWLGWFDKMIKADVFVILDNVQFERDDVQNRNRILDASSSQGWKWLTVPVRKKGLSRSRISDVRIGGTSPNRPWGRRNWRIIEAAYSGAPFFDIYGPTFEETLTGKDWQLLTDLNMELICKLRRSLQINTKMVKASQLNASGSRTGLLLSICKEVGATDYLSGPHGRHYLEENLFHRHGISVAYNRFEHPVYHQEHDPFVPSLSAIDLLFNEGPRASAILSSVACAGS